MSDLDLDAWKKFYDERVVGSRGRKLTASYIAYADHLNQRSLPPIFEFAHLAELVGVHYDTLAQMAHMPHAYYRSFEIPKRSGGIRRIDIPRPILMEVQKWILKNILSKIELSSNAHGFVSGRSIVTNARAHLGCIELLKIDIKDFFPSVDFKIVYSIFRSFGYPPNVSKSLSRLTTKNNALPQGAPTSPALSNLAFMKIDRQLSEIAKNIDLVYTRYADDLTFSGKAISTEFQETIEKKVSLSGFHINHKKTLLSREGARKIVTGISISSGELKLPRKYVRELRKQVHFVVNKGILPHISRTGQHDPLLLDRLLGMVSFWLQVSPDSQSAHQANDLLRSYIKDFDMN